MEYMKMRTRQKGASLIGVSLSILALIVIGTMMAKVIQTSRYEQISNVTFDRIKIVHDAMQSSYMNAIQTGTSSKDITAYPSNTDELIAQGYIKECAADDEMAGLCINQLKVPWVDNANTDQVITVMRALDPADSFPIFSVFVSLDGLQPIKLRNIVRAKLSQLPSFVDDGAGNISFTFKRPGSTLAYDSMVRVTGDTPMLETWDFGGQYLENVKDMAFTGITDRTAITGMVKMGSIFIPNNAGIKIDKPQCPSDYQAEAEVWTVGMGGANSNNLGYNIRSFAAWKKDNGISWQFYFRALGENSNGTPTFFYEGAVVYATWCEFI